MSNLDPKKETIKCTYNKPDGKAPTLAQMDWQGMYLYCRVCRHAHLFKWESLDLVRNELIRQHEAEKPVKESA